MPDSVNHANPPTGFWRKTPHYQMLSLVFPMLLAHITAPLMGLVDTAVLGHMQGSHYLAGASVGALILTQIYWVCGFIRMSTTGLSAQAKGQKSKRFASKVFYQSGFIALLLAAIILLAQQGILSIGLYFAQANQLVSDVITQYFSVRVWGAPAALLNLALIGWLLGQQKARFVMIIQIFANLLNIGLNLLFVYVFDWQVAGVAAATVLSEYIIAIASIWVVYRIGLSKLHWQWLGRRSLRVVTQLNSAMLIRNLALQACLIFITFQGVRLGQQTAAINALLMQFFVLISLGLDAIAYAVEAKVGEATGAKNRHRLQLSVLIGLLWSTVFALIYTFVFVVFGKQIIGMLTDLESLIFAASKYLPAIWLLPIVAHWCFLMDGVFVGLTRANAMRDSMLLSAVAVFFPTWWWLSELGNWSLWIALLAFLGARGVTLGGYYVFLFRQQRLVG